jgi:hypothetical protein
MRSSTASQRYCDDHCFFHTPHRLAPNRATLFNTTTDPPRGFSPALVGDAKISMAVFTPSRAGNASATTGNVCQLARANPEAGCGVCWRRPGKGSRRQH